MSRIPHARGVAQALRAVRGSLQKALKGLNQVAAQRMAKGDYTGAELLALKGKEIRQFQSEVDALRKKWRVVCGSGAGGSKRAVTPLWTYYQPILRALLEAGGECRREDLDPIVERLMNASLLPGDRETMARGRPRWRVMVQRSRRALIAEGWIEDAGGPLWKITDAGRNVAEKAVVREGEEGES